MAANLQEPELDTPRADGFNKAPLKTLTSSIAGLSTATARKLVRDAHISGVIFPWSKSYRTWWGLTVFGAILTFFSETFSVAFYPGGLTTVSSGSDAIEYTLLTLFLLDIGVSFFVAYRDKEDALIFDRKMIARHYLHSRFWIDVLGVFPFYPIALACAGLIGVDNHTTQYLALLELIKLVRSYRVYQLFRSLEYNTHVSLTWLTLTRNLSAALTWSHFSACVIYFIARQYGFDPDNTWIGDQIADLDTNAAYITSLYWAIVTFTTVGYGDYSPSNIIEQVWGIIFMMLNIIISAWIIGSMTLLIVKQDEETSLYRDTLQTLQKFGSMHNLDPSMRKELKTQLDLEFKNREVSDDQVLSQFPSVVRRKVLRKLYLPSLMGTGLMRNIRVQFIDAFLAACDVEFFSPGEKLLLRGSICPDLYLLIEGDAALIKPGGLRGGGPRSSVEVFVKPGDFINDIAFFTESPQIDTVITKSVCKTLTISRATYKSLIEVHLGSDSKILQNLLERVESEADESSFNAPVELTKNLVLIRSGFAHEDPSIRQGKVSIDDDAGKSAALEDLIRLQICKQNDELLTAFLFAAARGDTTTIARMCDIGFNPNTADYDRRTALMVAAMKGNTDAVKLLLHCQANPNLIDANGTTALYEATRKGHDDTMEALISGGGELCMDDALSASTLCQTVFDGDMLTLRRLLKAGINVDAGDYDKRTAAHIAAAEGNTTALKVLIEFGADLNAKDRWHRTVLDEARRSSSPLLISYLHSIHAVSCSASTDD